MGSQDKHRVILGLMTFGPPGTAEFGTRIESKDEFNKHLDTFQKRGYNEVDTARMYVNGLQEGWTKEAKWQERGLTLATKWYPRNPGDHAKAIVKEQFAKSISELVTEKVDIFYLHAPDRSVPFSETLEACNELYQAGHFKHLGLSNYASWEVAEICTTAKERGWVKPTIYQAMYNAITRAIDDELIPCCRKFGLDIVVTTEGRFSNTAQVIGNMYRERYFKDANFEALKLVEPVAEKHKLTLPQIALRWVVHHSKLNVKNGNDGIVIGVSSFQQLEQNLDHLEEGELPSDVVEALDQAWLVTKATCPLYWR
ncbi:hypothetical protein M409DRAFT_20700 [Zasmidium cellare ATCC 36951]|uniref:NADP-dependent oxidoreductase domain-containing protein n=1 Tax=Zasmidium cellare ATCC 36951 TaxID=1080233 RepID=A0A6A6CVF3_ZASCE|nr:uncharacterized protein M409DRAFT_20700 [Zasmidium cellare ATCC 36951]KAF2169486.1 hypothetical protein M409DRAFT_20700 [Zasmidium cellare ATCC 36951]